MSVEVPNLLMSVITMFLLFGAMYLWATELSQHQTVYDRGQVGEILNNNVRRRRSFVVATSAWGPQRKTWSDTRCLICCFHATNTTSKMIVTFIVSTSQFLSMAIPALDNWERKLPLPIIHYILVWACRTLIFNNVCLNVNEWLGHIECNVRDARSKRFHVVA